MNTLYFYPVSPRKTPLVSSSYLNFHDEDSRELATVQEYDSQEPIMSGDKVIVAFDKSADRIISADKYSDETDAGYFELYKMDDNILVYTLDVSDRTLVGVH